MSSHAVGYAKSSRAKCHGPAPCTGTLIANGALRYGETKLHSQFGETVEWRHWGCVTPAILSRLATLNSLDRVAGFSQLSSADQQKIRNAVSLRRVDPSDVPPSAQLFPMPAGSPAPSSTPSQKQRRAEFDAMNASSPQVTTPGPSQQQRRVEFEAMNASGSQTTPGPSQKKRKAEWEASQGTTTSPSKSLGHVPRADEEVVENQTPEVEVVDELIVTLDTQIVGVQYYKGLVGVGEEVGLIREPTNPYDSNAIQVNNISSIKVGHIPKNVAVRLAPLLDQRLVTIEGVMKKGNLAASASKVYTLDMAVKIYGPSHKRAELEPKLVWATPGQRGFASRSAPAASSSSQSGYGASQAGYGAGYPTPSYGASTSQRRPDPAQAAAAKKLQEELQKAADLKRMITSLEQVDDEERRSSLLDQLLATDDILKLPEAQDSPGIGNGLVVDLLKHQRQALQWALERENPVLPKKESDKPVQFWQFKKTGAQTYYYNLATKSPQTTPPTLGRGALCADAMGLGKTLTMLALILATKTDVPKDFSNSTLIVAPLSVLSNWEKQILDHCEPGALSYYMYYGDNRNVDPKQLQKYDVVITTYQTVSGEHDDKDSAPAKKKKKTDKSLFAVQWKRIILDEGHTIRNPKTKMAKACCALSAQRRWVLAATPIINSPKDLGSLLTFLRICQPLDNEDFFKRLLLRPLKDGNPSGADLLRNTMNAICIRRTKEMQDADGNALVPLPPVEMTLVPVTLSAEARVIYDEVEELSKNRVEAYMRNNTTMAQSNILSLLTRMRQLVLHTGLVPASYIEELRGGNEDVDVPASAVVLTPADKIRLEAKLAQAIEECEECPICFNVLDNARITSCAHIFCAPCITEVITRDPKCPLDRRPITMGDLLSPPAPMQATQAPFRESDESDDAGEGSSAKIDQLIQLLQLTPSSEKSLVFSQFTSFLDKIAERLDEAGISYVRFDGRMSAKRRQDTIAQFSIPLDDDGEDAPEPSARRRSGGKSRDPEDSDFVMDVDDGSDFIDDDDDDTVYSKKKGKGKGNAKAKGKAKGKATTSYASRSLAPGENPAVMLISLKAGALGLNLTVANNVYLMDPWWQEGIESQAIDRVNRIGQTKPVHVYQMIAENTVESKVLEIQERKKKLIKEAFSGMKRAETQRQTKEARLQDLIELFGIRQQAASQRA
ncbi:SNF2 family N-terminal domain-containing protein [Roridomyces roridus]|uniref:SNF2 family N-terminal domain-containing protein n=1 Tax=Roridomyces roridus TaxID=1738132 RepID=A0AAD7CFE0_9AGAR|nr:SNF2 family N-terminal domain-containing protein [Roridomyces roridus]